MLHAIVQLLLYGILAALSALTVAATVAVMQAGRLRALGFGVAFFFGQAFTCSLFVGIGVVSTGSKGHSAVRAGLDLFLAFAALALAAQIGRRPPARRTGSNERTRAFLDRLGRLRFRTTVLAGFVLGIGGPKRLLLAALAATAITTTGVGDANEALLVVWYVAVATVLVSVPVVCFALFGERVIGVMKRAQEGVARRQPQIAVYALTLIAAFLVVDAITLF